jgi:hypothetical protein
VRDVYSSFAGFFFVVRQATDFLTEAFAFADAEIDGTSSTFLLLTIALEGLRGF